jgi:MFS family permease
MVHKNGRKNVFFLGLVSLFTDLSSQMIYPLIPEFLVSLGASKSIIGLVEGIAESVASLFRALFGRWSDKVKKRKIFVFIGYGLSAFSKPFLYLADSWFTVLAVRFSERMGKAVRTPARDALISTSVSASKKGKAFGFHRAMDRTGALGGPLLAILALNISNENVRFVFLVSVIPAVIALIFIAFAKETAPGETKAVDDLQGKPLRSRTFIIFLISIVVFTLGNSSNAFLILKAREAGLSVTWIPGIWMFYNFFCVLSSPVFGTLSDKWGRKSIIIISFIYYSILYFLFGFAQSLWMVWALFGAYGIYYGLSEGVFRAYIADLVTEDSRATAYGIFNTAIGLALLPASLLMGEMWDRFGSRWAFIVSALFSLLGFLIFISGYFFIKRNGDGRSVNN